MPIHIELSSGTHPPLESLQRLTHEPPDRRQVVAALLDDHRREAKFPERPAGGTVSVRTHLQRALRVAGRGVVATDAPLAAADLARLARRAGLGLARTGSVAHNGSGEIFLAFSTGARAPRDDAAARPALVSGEGLDALFSAAVEATEEAVLNSLWRAEQTVGREGIVAEALPHDALLALLSAHGRLADPAA